MDSIILSPAPMPYLTDCSLKRFGTDEYHCSRYCSHFVLIFMLKNRLQFTENGSLTTLLAGEWYIQKKKYLAGGFPPQPQCGILLHPFPGRLYRRSHQQADASH